MVLTHDIQYKALAIEQYCNTNFDLDEISMLFNIDIQTLISWLYQANIFKNNYVPEIDFDKSIIITLPSNINRDYTTNAINKMMLKLLPEHKLKEYKSLI